MRWTMAAPFALCPVAFALSSPPLQAQTFDVKQVDVKAGSLELGLDNTVHGGVPRGPNGLHAPGYNRSAHDQGVDWGIANWWRLSATAKLENPTDADLRLTRVAIENLFVLRPVDASRPRDLGLGWFAAVDIAAHDTATSAVTFGPIVTFTAGKASFTFNPFFEKTFGDNHVEGLALAYGWQAKYDLGSGWAFGVEGFGHIDNLAHAPSWSQQDHRIGPVLFTEIALAPDFKITPDIGLLFGLTSAAPEVAVKFNVGVPLYQRR